MRRYFTEHDDKKVPVIRGAFGGGGSGGSGGYKEEPNSLFSTDILFILTALGEGPVYRVNPNGPQDIEITENSINDLLNIDGDGGENTDFFKTLSRTLNSELPSCSLSPPKCIVLPLKYRSFHFFVEEPKS